MGHCGAFAETKGGAARCRHGSTRWMYTEVVTVSPLVAVVVPVFNRCRVVLEALDSIAAQTRPPTKLIVVDDGSTDDTVEHIERWLSSRQLPFESRLIRQSNAGPSAARNRGAAEADECDLLAFLDSDDLWPTDEI